METDILQLSHQLMSLLPGGDVLWTAVVFILVLSTLVFIHEMGHYLAARSVGVGVEVFSIGFGREIYGWTDKHKTRWKISLIPLGGYVKMVGDEQFTEVKAADKGTAFWEKHVFSRIWVVAAGPLANLLLAIVFLTGLFMHGELVPLESEEQPAVVGAVRVGMPAHTGGVQLGDTILSVDGEKVKSFSHLAELIGARAQRETALTVLRDGETLSLSVTPDTMDIEQEDGTSKKLGRIGIVGDLSYKSVPHPFGEALALAGERTWDYSTLIVKTLWRVISGKAESGSVGGPIAIAEMASESAKTGLYHLLFFMAVISINLGIINLFPVPMLDGGHLLYYFAEAIKGSPVGEQAQLMGQRFGIAVLFLLMGFAFYNDIARLVSATWIH